MGKPTAAARADRLLQGAYPGKRQRAHAIRWLGWIAHRLPDRREFTWQDVPPRFREWQPRKRLARLFDEAVELGVLTKYGMEYGARHGHHAGYQFADPALQADLATAYQETPTGTAGKVIDYLAAGHKARLTVDGIVGIAVVMLAMLFMFGQLSEPPWWRNVLAGIAAVLIVTATMLAFFVWLAAALSTAVARRLTAGPTLTHTHRILLTAATIAVIAGIAARAGLATAVPAALVAACGLLVCVLIAQLRHATRTRWLKHLLAPLVDIAAIATASATVLVLSVPGLLTTQPAAGLLFPLACWGCIRLWRAMRASKRPSVRAAGDITLSILLGGELVVFLVWLANLVGMSRSEMATLRAGLERFGDIADLPWWFWTALYVLLAGLYAGFVHWPKRMAKVNAQFKRLRVVPVTNTSRRVLTCVHIGLLVIVLVGLAAPATLTVTLQRQLAATYAVAVQREFEAEGELIAYQQIRQQVSTGSGGSSQPLAAMVLAVKDNGSAPTADDTTENNESHVARGLGQLQATTLHLTGTRLLLDAAQAATREAGLDAPIRDAADAADRIKKVETEQEVADTTTTNAEQAGDLAAAAVAGVVSISYLSNSEILQVTREYLSGLVEESPLKDVFAEWTRHLAGATPPPGTEEMVEPNAKQIEQAASAELSGPLDAGGDAAAVATAKTESPLNSAADLVHQMDQLHASSGGDCADCGSSGSTGGQDDDDVPDDQPVIIEDGG